MELKTIRKVCRVVLCMFVMHAVLLTSVIAAESTPLKTGGGKILQTIEPGQKAIDFTINDLEGEDFKLSDVIGEKTIFLLFWSIFCQPCQEEIPVIQEMYDKVGKDKLTVLAISLDGDRRVPAIEKYIKKNKLNFTFLMDVFDDNEEGFVASDTYGVLGTPTLYIINKAGIVTYNHTGKSTLNELMKKVEEAINS